MTWSWSFRHGFFRERSEKQRVQSVSKHSGYCLREEIHIGKADACLDLHKLSCFPMPFAHGIAKLVCKEKDIPAQQPLHNKTLPVSLGCVSHVLKMWLSFGSSSLWDSGLPSGGFLQVREFPVIAGCRCKYYSPSALWQTDCFLQFKAVDSLHSNLTDATSNYKRVRFPHRRSWVVQFKETAISP